MTSLSSRVVCSYPLTRTVDCNVFLFTLHAHGTEQEVLYASIATCMSELCRAPQQVFWDREFGIQWETSYAVRTKENDVWIGTGKLARIVSSRQQEYGSEFL